MMSLSSLLKVGCLALLAPLAVACVVQADPGSRRGAPISGGGPGPGAPAATDGNNDGSPSATPILVDVDTNGTMTAAPGQGVGVFTEYTAGGHWHIWWTCDTTVNPSDAVCPFDVKISVASGAITAAKTEQFERDDTLSTTATQLVATTSTTTNLDGLLFDTDPGAVITLDVAVGGQHDSRILFFVQNNKVNGGFAGTLTDPLMLEGTTP